MNNSNIGIWIIRGALALLFAVYLGFGIHHLGQFQTADEDLWIGDPTEGRIHKYYSAWEKHDWSGTRINDKPGVTAALISGSIGLLVDRHPEEKIVENGKIVDRYNPPVYEERAFWFRLPILLANGLLILFSFSLVRRYTDSQELALLATGMLFLSPILIGISQIVNPDSTLWSFGYLSILAFLLFLKTEQRRFFVLAGVTLGFALLSKYAAVFITFFLCFATLLALLFRFSEFETKEAYARFALTALAGFLGTVGIALIIFSIFLPAVFLKPEYLFEATLGFNQKSREFIPYVVAFGVFYGALLLDALLFKSIVVRRLTAALQFLRAPLVIGFAAILFCAILFTAINWTFNNAFEMKNLSFDYGRGTLFDRLNLIKQIALEVRPLVFTVSPIILFFAIFSLATTVMRQNRTSFLLLALSSFITLYYAAMLYQGLLVNVRYSVILYPLFALLAAIGAHFILTRFIKNATFRLSAIIVIFFALSISPALSNPFYFNYTSSLLPKMYNVTGAWGYGGYEAAQHLNSLPDAKNLLVWSDYEGVCPFFVGKCIEKSTVKKWYKDPTYEPIQYIVSSRRGKKLNKTSYSAINDHQIVETIPEWELIIDDRPNNYIRVFRVVTPQ